MKNHTIICGFGRIGRSLAESFQAESIPFIVIDQDPEAFEEGRAAGFTMLRGDATSDETLLQAGIEHARRIVPVMHSDADNLFIVISARQLNPGLFIVARATDRTAADKMKKAGADRVVLPLLIGAQYMAQTVVRPTVSEFVRLRGTAPEVDYSFEEIPVHPASQLVDKSLIEIGLREELGVVVIGIKREEGEMVFNPHGATMIHGGDTLVALGKIDAMGQLVAIASGRGSLAQK
jgi:voltage-gated potassium channel